MPRGLKANPPTGYLSSPLATPAQIKAWEAELPGRNYAVIPGVDLTFIDMDVRDGKGGRESLDLLQLEYGQLPPTFTVRTTSGGLHYYFRGPHTFKNGFRPGLDCPQYVVAPWSMFEGKRYEVIDPRPAAPMPNWLPEAVGIATEYDDAEQTPAIELDQPHNIKRAIWHLTHDARRSIQGRNGEFALLLTAGELKDMGISKWLAVELLAEHYNKEPLCSPQWNINDGPIADRLDVKVENAWRYLTQTQPGANTPEADFGDDIPDMDIVPMHATAIEARKAMGWKERSKPQRVRNAVRVNGIWYRKLRDGSLRRIES